MKTLVETNMLETAKFCKQYGDCSCKLTTGTEGRYDRHEHAVGAHRPRATLTHHPAEEARPLEPGEWIGLGDLPEDIIKAKNLHENLE